MPLITGDASNNSLHGTVDSDTILGLGGDDLIDGILVGDSIDGGADSDTVSYADLTGPVTAALEFVEGTGIGGDSFGNSLVNIENVIGSAQGDDLTGSSVANRLNGGAGDDNLAGGGGNDTLIGGTGSNLLDGGEGTDTADYSTLAGPITAVLADGTVSHGGDADTLVSIERVVATASLGDTLDYSAVAGSGVSVTLETLPGSGVGEESFGHEIVDFENVIGSAQGDDLTGSSVANRLDGGAGDDNLAGEGGNDTLIGGTGSNLLDGGEGTDTADYSSLAGPITAVLADGTVSHGGEVDTLVSIERVVATASLGDTLDYSAVAGSGVSVTLETLPGSGVGEESFGHEIVDFENVIGSAQGDDLTGSSVANRLDGGAGDDNLAGGGGNDTLIGGTGSNLLDGGEGTDTADYSTLAGPITAVLADGTVSHGGDADTLVSIERVVATASLGDTLDYSAVAGSGVSVTLETLPGSGVGEESFGHEIVDFENVIGSAQGDDLTGSSVANRLDGGAGDDNLAGEGGNDTLIGGTGSNLLDGGEGTDTADYSSLAGPITAVLADGTVSHGGEVDTLVSIERVVATASLGDTLDYSAVAGSGVSVTLETLPGSGVGEESFGHEIVDFENVIGSAQGDDLTGSSVANRLDGGAGDDNLAGGGGNDTLIGGTGSNLLDGGEGTDTADYSTLAGPITAVLADGTVSHGGDADTLVSIERVVATASLDDTLDYSAVVGSGVSVTLETLPGSGVGEESFGHEIVDFENVIGSAQGDDLTGSSVANRLDGGAGDDNLAGGGGNDTLLGGTGSNLLDGGEGTDTADYSSLAGPITAVLADGTVSHGGDADTLVSIERVVATASLGDTLDYSAVAGSGVSVTLETLPGSGVGEESFGHEIVDFENVIGSAQGDDLTGSSVANRLDGGAGDDNLAGGGGNDTLLGGAGSNLLDGGEGTDTADYSTLAGPVNASLTLGTGLHATGVDTLIDIENLTGSAYDDVLAGDAGPNRLEGGEGNDTLVAGESGPDTLIGGAGFDVADYSDRTTSISVDLTTGLVSDGGTVEGVEALIGGSAGDNLTGNSEGATWIDGRAGDDVLIGGDNDDTLIGGAGDDLMIGGAGFDEANYGSAEGPVDIDLALQIATGDGTDTLIDIESVIGTLANDTLHGAAGVNFLFGNDGDDLLRGDLDGDTLHGGNGTDTVSYVDASAAVLIDLAGGYATPLSGGEADTLISIENAEGSAFGDYIVGTSGANSLVGGEGDDSLAGAGGNDTLTGGIGADVLEGGTGADMMMGGLGADTFIFTGSVVGLSTVQAQDVIMDFDARQGDKFDFSELVLTGAGSPSALQWQANSPWGVWLEASGPDSILNADTDGDGIADLVVLLKDAAGSKAPDASSYIGINHAPVVAQFIAAQVSPENAAWNFTVPNGTFSDPDGDTLSLVASLDGNLPLPNWLTFDPATQTFSGTPPAQFNGQLVLQLTANDGHGGMVSTTFQLDVAASEGDYFTVFHLGATSHVAAAPFIGPVPYLEYRYIGFADEEVVLGTARNDFINMLGGDDAANGGAGDDVIDGGIGSNFMSGGDGTDVFFIDGRGGQVTWSTIVDFDWQIGEQVALWGWQAGVSQVTWVDRAGAAGYEGVTMHADLDNNGIIDTSITWTGHTREQLPNPTVFASDGLLWFV